MKGRSGGLGSLEVGRDGCGAHAGGGRGGRTCRSSCVVVCCDEGME